MILDIPSNTLCGNTQELDLSGSNVCTLIGKNGSGKSSILETIFDKYSENESLRIISFSSGQNERFSKIYSTHKSNKFKKITQVNNETLTYINKFHFDKNWVKTLVFFATSLHNKRTRKFLKEKYIDADIYNDLTSIFNLTLYIPKFYINQIQDAYSKESTDPMHESVRRTYLHSILTNIIESFYHEEYDYEKELKINIEIKAEEVFSLFESNVDKIFTFLALTNYGSTSMFDISTATLRFKDSLEFDNLSDGEYQLLTIYALLDLFDSSNTLFLFDEIDSHLHYKNINSLWDILKTISGKLITTTHISESILNNNFSSLSYVENGRIINDLVPKKILEKISNVVNHEKFIYQVSSKLENLVLIDDESDWEIFKELVRIKIDENAYMLLNNITPLKEGSGWNFEKQLFGDNKIEFVKKIKEYSDIHNINLKNIFMICDNDDYGLSALNGIQCKVTEKIAPHMNEISSFNNNQTKSYLLSWRRREILHYMISYSMLKEYSKLNELKIIAPYVNSDDYIGNNFDSDANIKITSKGNVKFIKQLMTKENGDVDADNWTDYDKLKELISKIPEAEISDDITEMYKFIKRKIESN